MYQVTLHSSRVVQHRLDAPHLVQVELVGLFLAHSFLGIDVISKQQSSSWPAAASSVWIYKCSSITRETETSDVEEFSLRACWRDTDAAYRSLVSWAAFTASTWSPDFPIWVASTLRRCLTPSTVVHHPNTCWTGALSIDSTLISEARLLCWCSLVFTATTIGNNCLSSVTLAAAVDVPLVTEAGGSQGRNAPISISDYALSCWAGALAITSCELAREATWACRVAAWLPSSFDLPCWALADTVGVPRLVGKASLRSRSTAWLLLSDLLAVRASTLASHRCLSAQAPNSGDATKTS